MLLLTNISVFQLCLDVLLLTNISVFQLCLDVQIDMKGRPFCVDPEPLACVKLGYSSQPEGIALPNPIPPP